MYKTFGHSGLPISILMDGKIGQDIESSCTKTIAERGLKGRFLDSCFEGNRV